MEQNSEVTYHPAVIMFYNTTEAQLALSKAALESLFAQDIPLDIIAINNGSTLPTHEWLHNTKESYPHSDRHRFRILTQEQNTSPVQIVNSVFCDVLIGMRYSYVLGVPNDVVLPPNFYSELLKWPRGIITASMTDDLKFPTLSHDQICAVSECTPLAVGLFRRWVYEALVTKDGYFLDPGYFHYASDCDMALRISALGIRGVQLNIPYFHSGSASWRKATADVAHEITQQADRDRDYFTRKWGYSVSAPDYAQCCGDINFRAESKC
jgi:GT2 family glycosyltransferase